MINITNKLIRCVKKNNFMKNNNCISESKSNLANYVKKMCCALFGKEWLVHKMGQIICKMVMGIW